ncbi:MAG TPA: SPOR domain-containing protein [Candidatus Saccharimonadales bacterium]|nr:SPOR domain-containing protein [Candidatus Saccharimonadales bacterium]
MGTSSARAAVLALAAAGALAIHAGPGGAALPDPAEEMTPEELQTLPEPVPAAPAGVGASTPRATTGTAPIAPGGVLWRVQVFSTADPGLADRIARAAARILEAKAYVAQEASQYKVRLGDYASESEAAELRMRAVRSGYPGAFRIRCAPNPTLNND